MELTLDTPLASLSGVGAMRGKKLAKLGLYTAGDLLEHYPREYDDRRNCTTIASAPLSQRVCITAVVTATPSLSFIRKGLELVKVAAADDTGSLLITFFNQNYIARAISWGEEYTFFGVIERNGNRYTMKNPIFERAGHAQMTGCIVPIYPLTAGISNQFMAGLLRRVLPLADALEETLPPALRGQYDLCAKAIAVRAIHCPADQTQLALARRRLIFEELFYLNIGVRLLSRRRENAQHSYQVQPQDLQEFTAILPFSPTQAQQRVMEQIAADLCVARPMNRLVQGDVGSGKTAVAAFGAWLCAKSGLQTALMTPTEVLAQQHYHTLQALFAPSGVRVELLTGGLSAATKRDIYQRLARGEIDLIIGTQALISQKVTFGHLGLIIADEQHRFGVAQRAALAEKGEQSARAPHVLVMSATPIPRTLALIVYGDLDISIIDQMPPNRLRVETFLVGEDKRTRLYGFIEKQVQQGRQVYIVCPAVEEDAQGELAIKAATAYAKKLQGEVFTQYSVSSLHGKMRPSERARIMEAFVGGTIQILVSTTVIEVGVDVPNASLIVVENAERFGLSQLHQLRGRVGRGKHQSYCVLLTATRNPDTIHRLRTLTQTSSGFEIAEADLKLRGPGDFFGHRQHGLPQLKLASLSEDMQPLEQSQQAAIALLDDDPTLKNEENQAVAAQVRQLFSETPDIFN